MNTWSRWKVTKIIRQNRKSRSLQDPNLESSSQSPNHTDTIPASLGRPVQKRASKLDAFEPQLQQLLQRYPRITVIRLQEELQGVGYTGGYPSRVKTTLAALLCAALPRSAKHLLILDSN